MRVWCSLAPSRSGSRCRWVAYWSESWLRSLIGVCRPPLSAKDSLRCNRRRSDNRGEIQARAGARARRDGLGLGRSPPAARHPHGGQVHGHLAGVVLDRPGAVRARGPGRGAAPQRPLGAGARLRRGGRHALPDHGAAPGRGPGRAHPPRGAAHPFTVSPLSRPAGILAP